MKRIVPVFLILLCFLSGCSKTEFSDITPLPEAVDGIVIQRTNIDQDGNYTYFEKNIDDPEKIGEFCDKIDDFQFLAIEPVKFSSVDYLVVYQGKKSHKLVFSEDVAIYDGLAYKINKGDLSEKFSELYDSLAGDEVKTTSKIFS